MDPNDSSRVALAALCAAVALALGLAGPKAPAPAHDSRGQALSGPLSGPGEAAQADH